MTFLLYLVSRIALMFGVKYKIEKIEKYLSYVRPFGKGGAVRNTIRDIVEKVLNLIKSFKK